jgi:hypothetical protein
MKTLDRVADGGSGGHTPRGERGDLEGEMVHMAKEWVVKGGFGDSESSSSGQNRRDGCMC